jgi:uncharacterized membrane protein YbhN (UPF0104 family)
MLNKRLRKLISIISFNVIFIAVVAQWIMLHVDMDLILTEAMQLNQNSITLSLILGILLYFFYGLRLALFLDLKLSTSTQIVVMGFGLNAFLPFRLGDVLKILFAKQFFKVDLTKTSFATIIEKGLDLAAIGCLALIFMFGKITYNVILLIAFAILVFPIIYFSSKRYLISKVEHFPLKNLLLTIQIMLAKKKHRTLVISTVAIWVLTSLIFYFFFNMNSTGDSFTLIDAITLLIITTLSLSIPSMPASIGLFESGIVFLLTQKFHFIPEKAIAYALIFHLIMVLPQVVFTIIILVFNTLITGITKRLPIND